jgi:hypothetical protein
MAEQLDPRRDPAEPEARAAERRRLKQTARLLQRARPEPRAAFRADLGRRLQVEPLERRRPLRTAGLLDAARPQPRPSFRSSLGSRLRDAHTGPQNQRRLIAAYALSGAILLTAAAAGVVGLGPLAPG